MTNEAEGTPRRRPPTIDLTATEVAAEQAAGAAGDDKPPRPARVEVFDSGVCGHRSLI